MHRLSDITVSTPQHIRHWTQESMMGPLEVVQDLSALLGVDALTV